MKEHTIECPACHASGKHQIPAMADITSDTNLKNRLLDGTFFEWTCPGCSRRFFVDEVFLCCNSDRGYCIYLVPGYKEFELPIPTIYKSKCTGTLRVTDSFVAFAEKLRIFEAGLSDRIIEAMKAVYATVCQQTSEKTVYNMLFEEIRPDGQLGFTVLLENEDISAEIPAEAYDHAMADFDELLPLNGCDVFLKVDQKWLAHALNEDESE